MNGWRGLLIGVGGMIAVVGGAAGEAPTPPTDAARKLALLSRNLERSERVLYVTAHPDDEDAGLLARLVHGEGAEVALMTLTRGEGGQNEIGTELFHALGVLRSRELESAGAYTGVRQYFSRAFEFGYSFSVEESFDKWGHDSVLRDLVQVIREFRPDVILTMALDGPGGGQHHQASARLALAAWDVAASTRWPELGPAHATARFFRRVGTEDQAVTNICEIDLGSYDPVLGATYAAVGAASRAQHKCQGMARLTEPIARGVSRWEFLHGRSGDEPRPVTDFFAEPVSSLGDLAPSTPFLAEIRSNPMNHHAWLGLWKTVEEVRSWIRIDPTGHVRLNSLSRRLSRGLALAMGVHVAAQVSRRDLVPGDDVPVTIDATYTSGSDVSMSFELVAPPSAAATLTADEETMRLSAGVIHTVTARLRIGADAESTLPRPVPAHGDSVTDDAAEMFFRPGWRAFELKPVLHVEGKRIPLSVVPIESQEVDPAFPRVVFGDPMVVPDPSIRPDRSAIAVALSGPEGSAHAVYRVSSITGGEVRVRFEAPDGWRVTPDELSVETLAGGGETAVTISVEAIGDVRRATLRAEAAYAADGSRPSRAGVRRVEYPHIRPAGLWQEAEVTLVPVSCAVPRDVRVGLIEGAGDTMDDALASLGIPFSLVTADDLGSGVFDAFDVIISGVRAYKVRDDLKNAHARLMEWVADGGVWIVQYNKFEFNDGSETESPFAPYPATRVGRRRVTVEESPVVVNIPDHPVFSTPNPITSEDWEGWVQERGLYFLDFVDPRYQDLITLEDPWPKNPGPKGGALVATDVGRGHWVYLGIGLFRQLPAAVPGAYRLLANLVALGAD